MDLAPLSRFRRLLLALLLLFVIGSSRAELRTFDPAPALGDFTLTQSDKPTLGWSDLMGRWTLFWLSDHPPTPTQRRDLERLLQGELGPIPQPLLIVVGHESTETVPSNSAMIINRIDRATATGILPEGANVTLPTLLFVDALVRVRASIPLDTPAQQLQAISYRLYQRYKDECCVSGEPTRIEILGR